jgi:hypothetical protein
MWFLIAQQFRACCNRVISASIAITISSVLKFSPQKKKGKWIDSALAILWKPVADHANTVALRGPVTVSTSSEQGNLEIMTSGYRFRPTGRQIDLYVGV